MSDSALTLYVVDDDEALRRSLLLLLFTQDLAVRGFESGEAFLQALDPQQAGCVILDLRMGGMSGLSAPSHLLVKRARRMNNPTNARPANAAPPKNVVPAP